MRNKSGCLLILAFNEEENIQTVIEKNIDKFNEIIVVDDCSKDNTNKIINELSKMHSNLKVIQNEKNLGPGKSMEVGLEQFQKTSNDYLIKVDGDNQFSDQDLDFLIEIVKNNDVDFIKGDRFWENGIVGDIPLIRYLGNSFASFLLKLTTGAWKLNDPLNGLFLFSKKSLKNFKLPKMFYRYGYPFYVNNFMTQEAIINNVRIYQFNNTISYKNHKSNLKAWSVLTKLLFFSIQNIINKFKLKLKSSHLQISAILDIFNFFVFLLTLWSIFTFFEIRYFDRGGNQSDWFIIFLVFGLFFIFNLIISQMIQSKYLSKKIIVLEK